MSLAFGIVASDIAALRLLRGFGRRYNPSHRTTSRTMKGLILRMKARSCKPTPAYTQCIEVLSLGDCLPMSKIASCPHSTSCETPLGMSFPTRFSKLLDTTRCVTVTECIIQPIMYDVVQGAHDGKTGGFTGNADVQFRRILPR